MVLDKALLIKGLGGLTAIAATGTAVWSQWDKILPSSGEESIVKKAGLTCTEENSATGSDCTIDATKLKVNQDNTKTENISTESSTNGAKIKLYKVDETGGGYSKGFKLVVEGGDITLTTSSSSTIKLEELETYEIEEEGTDPDKKYYLTRKTKAIDEKKKLLGLPASDTNCVLPTDDNTTICCDLDVEKLKAINFEGKNSSGTPTFDNSGTAKLKISKATTETNTFTEGYKFILESNKDITIPKADGGNITIKANTNTEFKIKKTGNTLTLEKAWTVAELAKQVGLTDCASNECTIPTSDSLKLKNDDNDKVTNAKATTANQKIKYQEDVEGHNQGFKFYVENEVALGNDKKIENSNTSYEIKKDGNEWYLSKVTSSSNT